MMMVIMNSMENHFTVMTEVAGQDMMEVTMTMLDSYCPSIRKDLELTLYPQEKEKEKEKEIVKRTNTRSNTRSECGEEKARRRTTTTTSGELYE